MSKYYLGVPHHRKEVQRDNRTKIINELGKERLRFEELLERTGVSRATLSSHLKQLEQEEAVQKQYDPIKKGVVYSLNSGVLIKEIIIHDFIKFVGSKVIIQILELEMRLRDRIDLNDSFSYGTVENFFQQYYDPDEISYQEILNILKEEYGDWIEKESKEGAVW